MEHKTISDSERKLLTGIIAGKLTLAAGLIIGIIYLLTQREMLIIASLLSVVFLLFLLPGLINLFSDLSTKKILEGDSVITGVGVAISGSYNHNIRLSDLGKKKIRIQYADRNKLLVGKTIKYRISPKSKMLLSFEIVPANIKTAS